MSADMDNSKIIELVLGALDGDMDTINAIEDRVVRSKAKAALFKAKKDPEGYRAKNIVSSNDSEPSNKAVSNEVKDASLIDLVLKGLDGDMDSVNAIEVKVKKIRSVLK